MFFALILLGFCLVCVALAALSLYLNSFERKVTQFCEAAELRFRPGFYQELEQKASRQIESLAFDAKKKN